MPSSSPQSARHDWVVVGGGLTGLVAAWKLSEQGLSVCLVEAGRGLGGVNQSFDWEGHQIDLGCHFIGNDDDASTALFLDMLGVDPVEVSPRLASWNAGRLSPDVEYPDFTAHPDQPRALSELIETAACIDQSAEPADLDLTEFLAARFGTTAADLLGEALEKMLARPIAGLSAECAPALPIRRLLICSAAAAGLLKQQAALDDRLLQPWGGDTMRFNAASGRRFPARAFYPADGGMGAFTAASAAGLRNRGVDIRVGNAISRLETSGTGVELQLEDGSTVEAGRMIWTAGPAPLTHLAGLEPDIEGQVHGVPMVIAYFDTERCEDADAPHYVHDFDPDHLVFRVSSPTRWAPHVSPAGRAYLCCEATTQIGSDLWTDPDAHLSRLWDEACELGMASGPQPATHRVMKTPVSYKLPLAGFASAMAPLRAWLKARPRIGFTEPFTFAKTKIAREVDALIARQPDTLHA